MFAGRRTVFAGGFISQQHQSCLLFLVKFLFSRLFLLSSSFAFLLDGKFKRVNVLVPLMPRLFRVLLSESKVPACWKVAKLSPIHKKGEVLNPGNYRMIAVSGVMYRIFANVLKDLVADRCVKKGKIPDTQFGFFPGRSTLQPCQAGGLCNPN